MEQVKQFIDSKREVYIGQGNNSVLDRAYIREQYKRLFDDKNAMFAIKKVHVYLPCYILKGGFQIGTIFIFLPLIFLQWICLELMIATL